MLPARLAQALAPWLFGALLAHFGTAGLWFSAGLALSAFAALLVIRVPARAPERRWPPVQQHRTGAADNHLALHGEAPHVMTRSNARRHPVRISRASISIVDAVAAVGCNLRGIADQGRPDNPSDRHR